VATAGDTLRYTLVVTNPGDLPFPAASVRVEDPNCDDPPALVSKNGDSSPGTLDPGDTWTYSCSKKTTAGADCVPSVVPNVATVTGTTPGPVSDSSNIVTTLLCPPKPPEPEPEPGPGPGPGPQPPLPRPLPPEPPSPIRPPGPTPPDSGDAAVAGAFFRQITTGCIRGRVPRVNLEGTRASRVRVQVNDRVVRGVTVRALQRRLDQRVTLAPPGRKYRLQIRVTFQPGTGSPAVVFRATIRICSAARAARPPFTG
jgi:hypothetical protein